MTLSLTLSLASLLRRKEGSDPRQLSIFNLQLRQISIFNFDSAKTPGNTSEITKYGSIRAGRFFTLIHRTIPTEVLLELTFL